MKIWPENWESVAGEWWNSYDAMTKLQFEVLCLCVCAFVCVHVHVHFKHSMIHIAILFEISIVHTTQWNRWQCTLSDWGVGVRWEQSSGSLSTRSKGRVEACLRGRETVLGRGQRKFFNDACRGGDHLFMKHQPNLYTCTLHV